MGKLSGPTAAAFAAEADFAQADYGTWLGTTKSKCSAALNLILSAEADRKHYKTVIDPMLEILFGDRSEPGIQTMLNMHAKIINEFKVTTSRKLSQAMGTDELQWIPHSRDTMYAKGLRVHTTMDEKSILVESRRLSASSTRWTC